VISRTCTSALTGAVTAFLFAAGASALSSQSAQSAQSLRGIVLEDSTGAPVTAAEILLLLADGTTIRSARTDDAGRFLFAVSAPGPYTLRARRIGYESGEWQIEIALAQDMSVEIRLTRTAAILPTTTATAPAGAGQEFLEAFEHRRHLGLGGIFFTRAELEQRGLPRLPDLLRGVAGINISPSGRRGAYPTMVRSSIARQCSAVLYMDGHRMHRSDDAPDVVRAMYESIPPGSIEAVEIYKGRSQLPAEYGDPESRCGVVGIWTRRGSSRSNSHTHPVPSARQTP
jgi:hypothetical protein